MNPLRARLCACAFLLAVLQGCAIDRERASVSPDIDLSAFKRFYVIKFAPDGRGINQIIATQLERRGFAASTGADDAAPKDADAIVTYQDRWQWDLSMYMIELRIFMREPRTDNLLAAGNSLHTSLNRRSPEEMVSEVLSSIFKKAKKAP